MNNNKEELEKKEFNTAIESLTKIYYPTINLLPFTVHLSTSTIKEKVFIVELRKTWTINLKNPESKNKAFLKKLLNISLSGQPIIAEIKIECKDPFRQKTKLKQIGLL